MNVRQKLDELLELTAYQTGVKERIDRLRSELAEAARIRYEEEGGDRWTSKGVGVIRWDVPDPRPTVMNPLEFLEWVQREFPDEVEQVPTLRAGAFDRIIDRMVELDERYGNPETGEVVPGVEKRAGAPRLVVTLDRERKAQAIAEALEAA